MFTTSSNSHLIRSNIWSPILKDVLEDELMGTKYVRMLEGFPDGDTFNIPSIGQAEVYDYVENAPVQYTSMDTGNFTFTITDYKASGMYITEKMKQDAFYTNELVSSFVPKQHRAIMKALEVDILSLGPEGQTASNTNSINGAEHRWVAQGTNEAISLKDFAKANFALNMANVPNQNRVAILDPSAEYTLGTLTNLINVSYNPKWEGIVRDGIATGMKFYFNIFGFDVYMSQNLKQGMVETIGAASVTVGAANLFFSATPDVLPFVGAIRQPPRVFSEFNKDRQRDEYVTTMRYGLGFFRPENLCVVLSDTNVIV
jgi:hypothetical protein